MPPRPDRPVVSCADCGDEAEGHRDYKMLPDGSIVYRRTFGACHECHKCRKYRSPTRKNRRSTFKQSRRVEGEAEALFTRGKISAVRKGRAGNPDVLVYIIGQDAPFLVVESKHGNITSATWRKAHEQVDADARRTVGSAWGAVFNKSKPGAAKAADRWIRMRAEDFVALLATLIETEP